MKQHELVDGHCYLHPDGTYDPPSKGPFKLVYRGKTQDVFEAPSGSLFIEPYDSPWISALYPAPRKVKRWVTSLKTPDGGVQTWIYSTHAAAAQSPAGCRHDSKIHEIEIEV